MRIGFLCPHARISGGTKVIFTIADMLGQRGYSVSVFLHKYQEKLIPWFRSDPHFKLYDLTTPDEKYDPVDILIHYADEKHIGIPEASRHILFLQGFGSQRIVTEMDTIAKNYTAVIATSKWLSDIASKLGHTKVFTIPPGIDSAFRVQPVSKSPVVTIGTLYHPAPEKNINLFINTISKLVTKKKIRPYCILFGGSSVENVPMFDTLCLPYSIISNPPQAMLPLIYNACHLWISTSINEGFGLPILEAMACGVPVIWYPSRGLEEYLIHEKNCMIISNKVQAAETIKTLLNDKKLYSKLSENGFDLAKRFTWDDTISKFEGVLKLAIQ